jgi:methionyl-tRNA formyltransferase
VGAELMVKTLNGLQSGTIFPQEQDHSLATLAPILTREDGWIDFSRTAQRIYDRWRGFQPWPGAHTILRGKKLIVQKMCVAGVGDGETGVVKVDGDTLLVVCGGGSLVRLDEVQMEGRRRISAAEFLRGNQARSGERLGL